MFIRRSTERTVSGRLRKLSALPGGPAVSWHSSPDGQKPVGTATGRPTSACSRPATAPRSEVSGACVVALGRVDLPSVVSGQRCSGEVVATCLPRFWAQDAGG